MLTHTLPLIDYVPFSNLDPWPLQQITSEVNGDDLSECTYSNISTAAPMVVRCLPMNVNV